MSLGNQSFSLEELTKHHEQTQSVVHRYVTEADHQAMAAKALALDRLIVKAQKMIAAHLPDPDADDKDLVGKLIALFDGEEQRKAQCSMPVDCLREFKAQAMESLLSKCIYSEDHKVKIITESMIKNHAANVRKGLE